MNKPKSLEGGRVVPVEIRASGTGYTDRPDIVLKGPDGVEYAIVKFSYGQHEIGFVFGRSGRPEPAARKADHG
jgi:hypothetical protein